MIFVLLKQPPAVIYVNAKKEKVQEFCKKEREPLARLPYRVSIF